ncbi:hypothetical protein DPMN_083611, partial [Dreissena polymorpha]
HTYSKEQSHILGPFRQTSDKYLEGDSMNTHFGSGFTLHKLANMRRTRVGKPRPLLDQEKLDLFRGHDSIIVAKKFDRLVADVERKMRAALRRLKEMTGLD